MNSFLLVFFHFLPFLLSAPEVPLVVEITNVKKAKGQLWIAIFKPEEKFGENVQPGIYKIIEVKTAANQTADFNLVPGKYALAVFHDLNGNSVLDKNFIGIPKEPYGFSNDFRPKFSPPSFSDCAFEISPPRQKIVVKLTN
jgi:uncharacterized protein (DUF2141 family)